MRSIVVAFAMLGVAAACGTDAATGPAAARPELSGSFPAAAFVDAGLRRCPAQPDPWTFIQTHPRPHSTLYAVDDWPTTNILRFYVCNYTAEDLYPFKSCYSDLGECFLHPANQPAIYPGLNVVDVTFETSATVGTIGAVWLDVGGMGLNTSSGEYKVIVQ